MLVLTRKKGESLLISKNIKITILDTDGDKIKIGIDAPSEVPVLRYELLTETIDYNLEASKQKDALILLPFKNKD